MITVTTSTLVTYHNGKKTQAFSCFENFYIQILSLTVACNIFFRVWHHLPFWRNAVPPQTENGSRRSRPQIFYGRRETVYGERHGDGICADCKQSQCQVIRSFFCISNASQSDWGKSKLEYCGATWLRKRLAVGASDYSSGAHNHKQGPNAESAVPSPLIVHFNHWLYVFEHAKIVRHNNAMLITL